MLSAQEESKQAKFKLEQAEKEKSELEEKVTKLTEIAKQLKKDLDVS